MTNVQIVAHFFQDGYERKNYELVRSYLSEDYMDHSPAGARGSAQAVEILRIVASQLTELTVDLLDLFGDGDRVAARVRFEGVHTGAMMGIPATGKRISFEALEHFRLADGKIVESWGYWPDREIEEKLRC